MKNYLTLFACLGLLTATAPLHGQIPGNNLFLEESLRSRSFPQQDLYLQNLQDSLSRQTSSANTVLGVDLFTGAQNQVIDHYANYNDDFHFLFSPYLQASLNKNFHLTFRGNLENDKTELLNQNKPFWSDTFRGLRGGVEIGKIEYRDDHFRVVFGRDFFLPGFYPAERMLFSQYNYPYDQLRIEYRNSFLTASTYYLGLNNFSQEVNRHINGHRLTVRLPGDGYIGINDVLLYGGVNRQIRPALFNPLLPLYVYSQNQRNFESNTIVSLEFFYRLRQYFLFMELLVDDFQVDNETPADLEPSEYGFMLTLGKQDVIENLDFSAGYTRVANRTFNAPVKDYEKFIYKNYPIGHFLGNNFYEIKGTLRYRLPGNSLIEATLYYNQFGDEALYGEFNKDFLNSTVEEGYHEPFPFGKIRTLSIVETRAYLQLSDLVTVKGAAGYWIEDPFGLDSFSYQLSLLLRWQRSK